MTEFLDQVLPAIQSFFAALTQAIGLITLALAAAYLTLRRRGYELEVAVHAPGCACREEEGDDAPPAW